MARSSSKIQAHEAVRNDPSGRLDSRRLIERVLLSQAHSVTFVQDSIMLDSLAMVSPACKAYSVSEVKGVTPTMNLGASERQLSTLSYHKQS
ncbi:uncharacterized protein FFMR_02629 [Fusarium fujikuroi]|nr:uncharacterized protein FFMR_02629 [Fusarium fujikuroi]